MNIFWIVILFFLMQSCAAVPKQPNEPFITCRFTECTASSACRDIFNRHPSGHAVDMSEINGKPICSFDTFFDYENNTVIESTKNIIGLLHSNLLKTSKVEGACVFSPLGPYFFTEGEWHPLPELFTRTIYQEGRGNQNCVIHFSVPEENMPPDIFLKLGGIWLGERKSVVFQKYGEAASTKQFNDGFIAYIFLLDKTKQSYLAIETFPGFDNFIWSIQLSGEGNIPLKGLLGINIGSSETELNSIFGAPTERKTLTDIHGELLTYQGRNYSFELNDKKKVRSIKIIVPESFIRYLKP